MDVLIVVFQRRVLIEIGEVGDSLGVLMHDLIVSLHMLSVLFKVLSHLLTFDTHDTHEMVGGIAELGASELVPLRGKEVHCQPCLIEVNDFALCEEH